jgi:hypothetical protein
MSRWYRSLLFACCLVLATACSTSHRVPDDRDWAAVNASLAQTSVRVTLVNGTQVRASGLRISPDSTSWLNRESGAFRQVATASIARVEQVDRRRGALQGAKLGGVLEGIAGSLLAGYVMEPPMDEPEGSVRFRLYGSVLGGVAGGVLGLMHGGLIGRAVGYRTAYEFPAGAGDALNRPAGPKKEEGRAGEAGTEDVKTR